MTRTAFRLASLAMLCAITICAPAAATAGGFFQAPTSAPANVAAVPGNAKVTVSWSAVAGATGYRVFRAANGVWGQAPVASTTSLTHTSFNLTNGTTYQFTVAAYTASGNGPLSAAVTAIPLGPPSGVIADSGDQRIKLTWDRSAGAVSFTVYRKAGTETVFTELTTGVREPPFVDTGLTNGTRYYYQLRGAASTTLSDVSATVSAVPAPAPPAAAPALTAAPGNARVTLTWNAVADATGYRIYRSTTGLFEGPSIGSTSTATTYTDTGLVNGTTYYYTVAGRNTGGEGPRALAVTAMPVAPPLAPTPVSAVAGDKRVTLTWGFSYGTTSYRIYRGTTSNGQGSVPYLTNVQALGLDDLNVVNGPTYYYKFTAVNAGGESPRSVEVRASPEAPPPPIDPATLAAFRFLRRATWGPRPGDVEALKSNGVDAFLDQQFAQPPSSYPAILYTQPVELTQEHFMHLALGGPDQLRQRVAWALHKIWVVSAIDVDDGGAIATYQQTLLDNAFGNYRDLMRKVTLNPAMGRYLNMLNNRSQEQTGMPPNENYPRELIQLFTMGIPRLNGDGSIIRDAAGLEAQVYSENDVKELARIFTGWTFGDGNPSTIPTRAGNENWLVPMEAVARYHDTGAKRFLGEAFAAGQTAQQDLDQALDVIFKHPNLGPFIGRQLIQQLVTSNPSAAYVAAIAAVFDDNGAGVRGDLAAVVRAVLMHPEAAASSPNSGKLSEPVLFVVSQLRALNAMVTDSPFMTGRAEAMGQKPLYPGSVFSYYSPGYRVRGTVGPTGAPLGGPEFQILTSVTALERVNFTASLLGGYFGDDVIFDLTPFQNRAADPAVLVDYCSELFMGTRISQELRAEIILAVRASAETNTRERARTALYLILVAAQSQVDW